ncbi:APC family permease [Haloplanus sp. GCM10025708]|uniref:APC family permease n=1 Tax=Haloferacaceae TaxID=1644056 RepID=UPI0036104684
MIAVNDGAFLRFLARHAGLASPAAASRFVATNGEVAMAQAARYYLGDAGFYVFVVGALLSMISAANATILAGSRVKLAMARHDHLPDGVGAIHPSYGIPYRAILLTGGITLGFVVLFSVAFGRQPGTGGGSAAPLLGLGALAHLADFLHLGDLAFVNVTLVQSRRKYPDRVRRFRVPGVPWVPALAVASNLALLTNVEPTSLALGVAAVAVGAVLWTLDLW